MIQKIIFIQQTSEQLTYSIFVMYLLPNLSIFENGQLNYYLTYVPSVFSKCSTVTIKYKPVYYEII